MEGKQLEIFNNENEKSDIAVQVKNYELAKRKKELVLSGKLRTPWQSDAEMLVRILNSEFPNNPASVEPTKDARGEVAYMVKIDAPTREEFSDIVDEEGNLLPEYQDKSAA